MIESKIATFQLERYHVAVLLSLLCSNQPMDRFVQVSAVLTAAHTAGAVTASTGRLLPRSKP